MSVEHRERIERILYKIVNDLNERKGHDYPDREQRLIYILGYLIGLVSQAAADDSFLENRIYTIIRQLRERE